jgi:hypothetical protein
MLETVAVGHVRVAGRHAVEVGCGVEDLPRCDRGVEVLGISSSIEVRTGAAPGEGYGEQASETDRSLFVLRDANTAGDTAGANDPWCPPVTSYGAERVVRADKRVRSAALLARSSTLLVSSSPQCASSSALSARNSPIAARSSSCAVARWAAGASRVPRSGRVSIGGFLTVDCLRRLCGSTDWRAGTRTPVTHVIDRLNTADDVVGCTRARIDGGGRRGAGRRGDRGRTPRYTHQGMITRSRDTIEVVIMTGCSRRTLCGGLVSPACNSGNDQRSGLNTTWRAAARTDPAW